MKSAVFFLTFASTTAANCACGYTINSTERADYALFTELFETDFLHLRDVTFNDTYSTGWIPQNYNTPATESESPYGMAKESANIVPNYIEDQYDWAGSGVKGPDPGLQLWVRSQLVGSGGEKMVSSAELVSERDDLLYGSFRIAMKTTNISGTCSAFFFYRNDSQEVDLEILSAERHNQSSSGSWPIHLVVQNTTASTSGSINYDGSAQMIYNVSSAIQDDYNEYRFDWLPGKITYFVNGELAWTTTENVPSTAGRIHLSHWSNGNSFWSQGPPKQDAVMTVSYVKAYFNSTNETRIREYDQSCPSRVQTCEIPTQNEPPNPFGANGNETGHTFFFTHQQNMTPGQVEYNGTSNPKDNLASARHQQGIPWVLCGFIMLWAFAM